MSQLCTISGGAFQDASGNPIALGKIIFRMTQDAVQGVSQLCAGRTVEASLNSSGNVVSLTLWGSQSYEVAVLTATGLTAWSGTISIPNAASHSLTP